jgi:predicted nucleic acid-binding protein
MAKTIGFFDSNILIAASVPSHPHHSESLARLALLQEGSGACSAHTLAEVYNILTKHPKGYGIPPADAVAIVTHATNTYRLVSLTPTETFRMIEDAGQRGLRGSLIYDALLIACARKISADIIYTSNVRHFRQIAPDLASRIVLP